MPTLLVGAWRDAFQRGAPLMYAGLQNAAAGRPVDGPMAPGRPVSPKFQLVEGPWYHATLGLSGRPSIDLPQLALRWFDRWLKDDPNGIDDTTSPLRSHDMATGEWTESTTYPMDGTTPTKLYFDAGRTGSIASSNDGRLVASPPTSTGSDRLVWSNLPQCTPSISQSVLIGNEIEAGLDNPCNHDDRPVQLGPSATTYTTDPMTTATTMAGPISARVFASATTTDTQWVVRIEDVAPDGTSTPLTRGGLLGSFRQVDDSRSWHAADGSYLMPYHPYTKASSRPVVPGVVTQYDVEVFGVQATIAPGHRLRVTVGTSDVPAAIPTTAQTLKLLGGVYRIQRGGAHASYVQLPLSTTGVGTGPCTDVLLCPRG